MKGKVLSINISPRIGEKKKSVNFAILKKDSGIIGDAHAGNTIRQVSLLPFESFKKMKKNNGKTFAPGISAIVLKRGKIRKGDNIEIINNKP